MQPPRQWLKCKIRGGGMLHSGLGPRQWSCAFPRPYNNLRWGNAFSHIMEVVERCSPASHYTITTAKRTRHVDSRLIVVVECHLLQPSTAHCDHRLVFVVHVKRIDSACKHSYGKRLARCGGMNVSSVNSAIRRIHQIVGCSCTDVRYIQSQ